MLGLFQDAVIGIFELTQSKIQGIDKYHAMKMCNRTSTSEELNFDRATYTGRDMVSKFCPRGINYSGRAKFYEPAFVPYINYKEDEINVLVKDGDLETGVLDVKTIGQGAEGGLPHIIYNEKGPEEAINTLYNWQQVTNSFCTLYHGITFGFAYISKKAREKINLEAQKIMAASLEISKQLEDGKLVAPIGMTLDEFYEELQMAALEHGDEFLKPVMEELDIENDWLYKFIVSGSKGKKSNMLYIFTSIGSIGIKGKRIKPILNGRTSINFQRFSTDPMARGYNPSNFMLGIKPITFPFAAQEARYELIEVALSTAKAGTMNRDGTKNLESIVVSNLRSSTKEDKIVQLLYGETGMDPRKVEKITFPTVKISNKEFEKYRATTTQLDKKFRNSAVDKHLNKEFEQLTADRELYRSIFLKMEAQSRKNYILQDTIRMPVNIARIINNVLHLESESDHKSKKDVLDPVAAIKLVKEYCDSLGYVYLNYIQRKAKSPIPRHIEHAIVLLKILIRSYLCCSQLIRAGVTNTMLQLILDRITNKIVDSFIQYGTSVGIIAAQSISEPMTQYLLDAKHRTGLQKKGVNVIDRFDEILRNKATEDMISPTMMLIPIDEYKYDKLKVQEIANHIEMLSTQRFITSEMIFLEEFGKPEYPPLVGESKMIASFQAANFGDNAPRDLINWCIRFTFSKDELILKSMKIKTIYLKLRERYPNLYIVYTPQIAKELIMRIYIRNSAFKKTSDININSIVNIANQIRETVIRGIDGIKNTAVIPIAHTFITEDGSLDSANNMYGIETDGTNLSKILENKFLNIHECSSSSIHEIEKLYGIEAARNKTVDELMKILEGKSNYEHASIYADEMTANGRMTSIQRSGLGKREKDNVMLRATFGSPIQVLTTAAIDSQTDDLHGMSAPLVMGTVPRFGTTFNDIAICSEEVEYENKSAADIIEEL